MTELKRKLDTDPNAIVGMFDPVRLASGDHLAEGAQRDWGFDSYVTKDGEVRRARCDLGNVLNFPFCRPFWKGVWRGVMVKMILQWGPKDRKATLTVWQMCRRECNSQ